MKNLFLAILIGLFAQAIANPILEEKSAIKKNAKICAASNCGIASNSSTWKCHEFEFEKERITINFLSDSYCSVTPKYFWLEARQFDGNWKIEYSFFGATLPLGKLDPIAYLNSLVSALKKDNDYELVKYEIFQDANDFWVLDYDVMEYEDWLIKARVIVTPNNIYVLEGEFIEEGIYGHRYERFRDSFKVRKK